jgi:hypothetical protein
VWDEVPGYGVPEELGGLPENLSEELSAGLPREAT